MKIFNTIFLFSFLNFNTLHAQQDVILSHRIDSLAGEDQKERSLLRQGERLQLNRITRRSLLSKIAVTDSLNFPMLKTIFLKHGYAGYDLVGKKSSHNFWLLVQHQERHPDFQDSVLVKMKEEVDKKNASSADYATLVDKVKINAKQPQVYGTQLQVNKDSTSYEPKTVIEPLKLNERRKSVGLSTIEEYIEMSNSGYFNAPKKK